MNFRQKISCRPMDCFGMQTSRQQGEVSWTWTCMHESSTRQQHSDAGPRVPRSISGAQYIYIQSSGDYFRVDLMGAVLAAADFETNDWWTRDNDGEQPSGLDASPYSATWSGHRDATGLGLGPRQQQAVARMDIASLAHWSVAILPLILSF